MENIYDIHLDKNEANYEPLSPLSFIKRTAMVYPDRPSVIHGDKTFTWKETYERSVRLASALTKAGIKKGDTVAVMGNNTPETYEAHFGVPMCGAVLNTLNIRLDAEAIAFILQHGEAKIVFTDREFSDTTKRAIARLERKPLIIDIDDPYAIGGELIGMEDYESFIAKGDADFEWEGPADEWDAISLNYTSGTTGNPKGVVYHHRGAYLNAIGNALDWNMKQHPVYLWTLPMFHCNGWCFPWTLAAKAGTNICLRRVNAKNIYEAIADHKVTNFCGAPIVLSFVINATEEEKKPFDHKCDIMTAAAPPPASVLKAIQDEGFDVTHAYGLTETYGPAVFCAWKEEWNELPIERQAYQKSRQGVRYTLEEGLMIADSETTIEKPWDGESMGEVCFRGNIVMKGYLKNPTATDEAFKGGWFHSGDLGVKHPDGYIQLKDRSKDIIISGGENISSIEVEDTLYRHPDVAAVAVVAKPDEKWGETPAAFIELNPGAGNVTEEDLIKHCRDNLAHFKCPRTIIFQELPKTSTGKIQKFVLRDALKKEAGLL
ncbi:acyl-CoA synthetase [Terasakiella pusilla]|uniref:acyl-CoA synthetase n=1 Tax=Terasakiella pusilla TaxID=64973 RepID=UPI00048E3418|nr:acyl-CoA synthetase [Terasakiella pusilla]